VVGRLPPWNATLTRLHLRYTKDSLGEDLVFRAAPPIVGGNGWSAGGDKHVAQQPRGQSMFQGRYIVRHRWQGEITGADPVFDRGGGRPDKVGAARDLAFTPREGTTLASLVAEDVPSLGLSAAAPPAARKYNVPITAYLKSYLLRTTAATALGLVAGIAMMTALFRRARRAK
jgi:hypothetical protein